MTKKIWACKIGEVDAEKLPPGSDGPMRRAIELAYNELTGESPEFIFSGWGGELTEGERAVVENRPPNPYLSRTGRPIKRANVMGGGIYGDVISCPICQGDGCFECDNTGELHDPHMFPPMSQPIAEEDDSEQP